MIRRLMSGLLAAALLSAVCLPAIADNFRYDNIRPGTKEVSLMTYYGENHHIPEFMRDHFIFDGLKFKIGRFVSPRAQTTYEFAASNQLTNGSNWAVSSVISHKRNFLVRGSTALAYDAAFGFIHFLDYVPQLGTKTNFTEQLGISLQYGTSRNSAFVLEYRFAHISNAGIRLPNVGLNISTFSIGHSWYK